MKIRVGSSPTACMYHCRKYPSTLHKDSGLRSIILGSVRISQGKISAESGSVSPANQEKVGDKVVWHISVFIVVLTQ